MAVDQLTAWNGTGQHAGQLFRAEAARARSDRDLIRALDTWVQRRAIVDDRKKNLDTTNERGVTYRTKQARRIKGKGAAPMVER